MADLRAGVDPKLLSEIDQVLVVMSDVGLPMRICQGVREAEYQHGLWLQGRDATGAVVDAKLIVTNADGYIHKSNHQRAADGLGKAVDCCFQGDDPFLKRDPHAESKWKVYVALVRAVGLRSGVDFPMVDRPHAELPKLPPSKGPQDGQLV